LFYAAVAQSQHIRDYADTTQPVGSLTPVADAFEADSPGGLAKGALHSPLGCSLYFRVADTAPGDAGMDSAGGSVAMRTSSLKFRAAGDRRNMITGHFWPPCRVFLVHIGKEAIFLSIKPHNLGRWGGQAAVDLGRSDMLQYWRVSTRQCGVLTVAKGAAATGGVRRIACEGPRRRCPGGSLYAWHDSLCCCCARPPYRVHT